MPRIVKIIFFTIFLDMIGFGILIPIIPELVADPRSMFYLLPPGMNVETGLLLLGLLTATFPFGQFLATPILGQLSDRYGRKPLLIISILVTSFSYFLFAIGIITKNIPLLFVARFFEGISGGKWSVSQATIADITTTENRTRNFGMIGAAFGLGFIFGPFLGGILSDKEIVSWFTVSTPFYFASILALINVFFIWKFLPETNTSTSNESQVHFDKPIRNIISAFRSPKLKGLFATSFLLNGGFAFFTAFFSVFLITKFGYNQSKIGFFFGYVGICVVLTQIIATRWASRRFTPEKILTFAILGCSIMLLVFFLPQKPWELFLVPPLFSLCIGLCMANLPALVSSRADKDAQGEILGINASVSALAQTIPPIVSGFVAAAFAPTTPILVASGVVFVSWLVFLHARKIK